MHKYIRLLPPPPLPSRARGKVLGRRTQNELRQVATQDSGACSVLALFFLYMTRDAVNIQ